MGYILPVTPLQYADYANRLNQKNPSFTYIEGVQAVEAQNRFYVEVRRQQERLLEQEQKIAQQKSLPIMPTAASTDEVVMYRPKPMSTAEIVGKGFVINAYA